MEVTLDLLVDDWLNSHPILCGHFKVFRYSETDNPSAWPSSFDNYLGMVCDLSSNSYSFTIADDHLYRLESTKSAKIEDGYGLTITKRVLYAANPRFFEDLAYYLAMSHQKRHGPRGCKLYDQPGTNHQRSEIVFND